MSALTASQTVEEPLDLIRLSLDEVVHVKCKGMYITLDLDLTLHIPI